MTWRSQQDIRKIRRISTRSGRKPQPSQHWNGHNGQRFFEMTVFAKDGIEVRNLQKNKHGLVEPTEPMYEVEITGETEDQKKNREVRSRRALAERTTW